MKIFAYVSFYFFLSITSLSCQQPPKPDIPDNLTGMLLYIEDLDGKDGNYSWDFGDLTAYDPESNRKYILTSNSYFDACPSYSSRLNKVAFRSERYKESAVIGILGKANIYVLDLNTKQVNMLTDKKFKAKYKEIFKEDQDFRIIPGRSFGETIVFSSYVHLSDHSIFSYNLESDSLSIVIRDIFYASVFMYVPEEDILICEKYENPKNYPMKDYYVSIFSHDVKTGRQDSIIIADSSINKILDYRNGILLYEETKNGGHALCLYNVKEKRHIYKENWDEIRKTPEANPVFGKTTDEVYFINETTAGEDDYKRDIYRMNLKTEEIKQITTDGHIKNDLTYCR